MTIISDKALEAATAWEGYWPGAGVLDSSVTRVTKDKVTVEAWAADGAEVTPLVTLASLQAMQARAEKAERERDAFRDMADGYGKLDAELAIAEARVKELEEAFGPLLTAAIGLSHGQDWNKGTHALTHGYRQQLLDAIPAALSAIRSLGDKT